MKKIGTLFAIALLFTACKSNETGQKIDFTKSYENAALALTNAQKNYEAALSSNDSTMISQAKIDLQSATANYITSKNQYVANGGVVKSQYEQTLSKSEHSLIKNTEAVKTNKSVVDQAGNTISTVDKTLSNGTEKVNKVSATVENTRKNITDKVAKTKENINTQKTKAKQSVDKVKTDFDNTKKSVSDEAKKAKSTLDNLFKN